MECIIWWNFRHRQVIASWNLRNLRWRAASGETIEAVNTLKQGRVRVEKVDERKPEEKLAGAVFEVKNRETGEKVQMETDESGQAESPLLPIGTIGENGSWIPYHYEVRETMPPDGYQLIPRVYEVLMVRIRRNVEGANV